MIKNMNLFEERFKKLRYQTTIPDMTQTLSEEKLIKIKEDGITKKLMGIKIDINEISVTGSLDLTDDNNNVIGELRYACYSPHFKKVIGIAMMQKEYWNPEQNIKVVVNGHNCVGKVCDLPFI